MRVQDKNKLTINTKVRDILICLPLANEGMLERNSMTTGHLRTLQSIVARALASSTCREGGTFYNSYWMKRTHSDRTLPRTYTPLTSNESPTFARVLLPVAKKSK